MEKNTKKVGRSVRQISVSALALIMATVLLFGAAVGGTLAWLMRKTETIQNTFILGNITSLTLTDNDANADNGYKPEMDLYVNQKLKKTTALTIGANSVNSYLYIKVETSGNFSAYVNDYAMADGWIQLMDEQETPQAVPGVYYREYSKQGTSQTYQVLKGEASGEYSSGYLQAKSNFPNYVEADYTTDKPWIKFTGYAVQIEAGAQDGQDDYSPYTAWLAVNEHYNPGT